MTAAALGAIALGVVAITLAVRVPADISLNYGEGFVQLDALRLARGEPLYGDPAQKPWALQVYTPLYLWLVSLCARAGAEGYAAGRLLGYAAVLSTALLIGLSGGGRSRPTAWCAAALYLTAPVLVSWGAAVRPDNLAVLCATAGVIAVDRYTGRRAVYAAAPLFLAAGLAKQSSLAAPAAALLWLVLRDRRRALGLAALLAAGALVAVAALQAASGGWFWLHAVTSHALKPFAWGRTWSVLGHFARFHWPLIAFAAGLVAWLTAARRPSVVLFWLLLSSAVALSAGKSGSDTNYLLEPTAALALLAARELRWPPAAGLLRPRRAATLTALAAALGVALYYLQLHLANAAWIPEAERRFAAAVDARRPVVGDVVADDAGFLLATGRPLLFQPFIMSQLARAGLWDERPLVEALERGAIALVVVQRGEPGIFRERYTPALRRALAHRYRRVGSYTTDFEYEILAPVP